MTMLQIFSISISFISLVISIITAYFAYFRSSQLMMLPGRILVIANTYLEVEKGKQWGGLSFILPLTFYNWSPKGTSVNQIRLIVERKENNSKCFDIAWSSFVNFFDGGSRWESNEMAYPIAIQAQSSLTKFVRFDWSPLRQDRIEIREGGYTLTITVWTTDEKTPNLAQSIDFHLTIDEIKLYQKSVSENLVIPIQINLGNSRSPNLVGTKQEIFHWKV